MPGVNHYQQRILEDEHAQITIPTWKPNADIFNNL